MALKQRTGTAPGFDNSGVVSVATALTDWMEGRIVWEGSVNIPYPTAALPPQSFNIKIALRLCFKCLQVSVT